MMCITSATFTSVRRLSIIASGAFIRLAKARARSTPPASGETMVSPASAGVKVLDHHRRSEQMIHRNVEETLDLRRVQVHGQHPVGARPSR